MRTSAVEAVVLLALLSLAPMAEAQVAAPDYVFLDTEQTSTLQRELQEAADNEYRLVPGQGSWGRQTAKPSWSCSAHRVRLIRHTSTLCWEPNGLAPWKKNSLRQPGLIFPRCSRFLSDLSKTTLRG